MGWLAYRPPAAAVTDKPASHVAPSDVTLTNRPAELEADDTADHAIAPRPLPVFVRDLAAQADAGDARAACQLGTLLSTCRQTSLIRFSDEQIAQLRHQAKEQTASGDLTSANYSARLLLLAQNHRRYCEDLPPSYLRRAPTYLRQAALAGNRRAQVAYLRGDGFMLFGAVDGSDFTNPAFHLWREEAIGLLQSLLREGRPEAVLLLLEAHSHQGSNLGMITPPDPRMDLAYLRLAKRLFSDFHLPNAWQSDPTDARTRREADTLADRWHEEHFAGRRIAISESVLDYGHPFQPSYADSMFTAEEWKSACDPDPGAEP
ncbi:hypothetical protein [Arenimonas aestuarii]